MDTIIVKQERGKDTTITVCQDERQGYGGSTSWLVFESDQKLTTGSGRAWEAVESIKDYCYKRGYSLVGKPGKFIIEARYDQHRHSGTETYKLQLRIKSDARFTAAVEVAKRTERQLNEKYAPAVAQLKRLAFVLEKKLDKKLDQERAALKELGAELAQEFGIPSVVLEQDRKRLLTPYHPLVEIRVDQQMTQSLPNDFDAILALLD